MTKFFEKNLLSGSPPSPRVVAPEKTTAVAVVVGLPLRAVIDRARVESQTWLDRFEGRSRAKVAKAHGAQKLLAIAGFRHGVPQQPLSPLSPTTPPLIKAAAFIGTRLRFFQPALLPRPADHAGPAPGHTSVGCPQPGGQKTLDSPFLVILPATGAEQRAVTLRPMGSTTSFRKH